MFGMTAIPQIHVMRKLVIDGSNTSGFQRTALVAVKGALPNGGEIETICLEEEAAQRVKDDLFSLDRLGIPLIEITTSPCMHTPEEVQKVAEYIGMVLRSTGKVKRGIGTIRQDVNISIASGARVEIKGVQELDLIAEVVRREVQRQQILLAIHDELQKRNASVAHATSQDVTGLFKETKSAVLKKAKRISAITLKGFAGIVGRELQPDRRFGSEISDYAKKCGVGGIFHTDELPAYGITSEEVKAVRSLLNAADDDCVVMVTAPLDRAHKALQGVAARAGEALAGVPEETRRALPDGASEYMRPLPGSARMYPETDVPSVVIDDRMLEKLVLPELFAERAARFERDYGLNQELSKVMAASPNCFYCEFPYEPPGWVPEARDFMLTEPFRIDKDGYINVPQKPGLGIELDMDRIKACGEKV